MSTPFLPGDVVVEVSRRALAQASVALSARIAYLQRRLDGNVPRRHHNQPDRRRGQLASDLAAARVAETEILQVLRDSGGQAHPRPCGQAACAPVGCELCARVSVGDVTAGVAETTLGVGGEGEGVKRAS